jgi:hypothetical protein
MLTLGLSAAERAAFEYALRHSHTRRIDVEVLTLNGDVLSQLTPVLIDGQVNCDMDAEVTRSATLTFLDPRHALNFDTDSPDEGALYADRMIRIRYGVYVEKLQRYVFVPVFTGPITGLSREGVTVTVEAQGKESLLRGTLWEPLTLRKGLEVTAALRALIRDRGGERSLSIPGIFNRYGNPPTLPKTRSLDRFTEIWPVAMSLAKGLDRQLFYTGDGVATLRPWPETVAYTFTTGDGGDLLSELSVNYQLDEMKNVVIVRGQPPTGKKEIIFGRAQAPKQHPLSPERLGRTGAPRYLVEQVEDQSIRTDAAAKEQAARLLEKHLREVVEVEFDAMPIPHLDVGDVVRVQTPSFTTKFRIRKFAIPLAPTGAPPMTVGYLRRLTPVKRSDRRSAKR